MKSGFVYFVRLAGTLLLITGIMAGLLAGVNWVTAPRIEAITAEKTQAAIAAVLPDPEKAQALDQFPDDTGLVRAVYASPEGYAIQVAPTGFDGEIRMMVGVGKEGQVLGIAIIDHGETAGLGAVAAAQTAKGQSFRDQFVGKTGSLAVTKDGGEIDALTSATITSRGVTAGVNAALACAGKLD